MDKKYYILYPISLIYRFITDIRNFLFDKGILHSEKFSLPVICVGNITVGGTGKTPHTEYLARLLKERYKVAVLSRGYKRKSEGFLTAGNSSTVSETGDEPLQIHRKYNDIIVAVDRKRVNGIREIMKRFPDVGIIILDDAFQHRSIKPGFSILLTDYNRLITGDQALPYGRLRESIKNCRRADIMVVTKTPENISLPESERITKDLGRYFNGNIFFTCIRYCDPEPVFPDSLPEKITFPSLNKETSGAVLVTGIAVTEPLKQYIGKFFSKITHLDFPDHHYFNSNDIGRITAAWENIECERKFVITTSKDAVRLTEFANIADSLKKIFYYIPVEIGFINDRKQEFNNLILDYVGKNTGND